MLATPLLMSPIFFRDVWIRTQIAAIASRRAINLATHLPLIISKVVMRFRFIYGDPEPDFHVYVECGSAIPPPFRAPSLESIVEGHYWFEIPRRKPVKTSHHLRSAGIHDHRLRLRKL